MFYLKLILKISILKSIYYSLKFRGKVFVGKKTSFKIYKNARINFIDRTSSLYVGVYFDTNDFTSLILHENANLTVGKSVWIHKGCKIIVRKTAKLLINNDSFINERSIVDSRNFISIGKKVAIGWQSIITDSDHHNLYLDNKCINKPGKIEIDDNVWVGARVIILKNVKISKEVVVAAGTIVTKNLTRGRCLYGANPIRVIKERITWD